MLISGGPASAQRRVQLSRSCTYRSRVTFRSRKRFATSDKLTVRVRFLGNAVLAPRRAKSRRRPRTRLSAWTTPSLERPGLARGGGGRRRAGARRRPRSRPPRPTAGRRCASCCVRGIDERGAALLHQLRQPQGPRARRQPGRRARAVVAGAAAPAARRGRRSSGSTAEESDAYFASRGRGSQLGAWASRQGSVIPGREVLDGARRRARRATTGEAVPRPEYWGGYLLRPTAIEFWEGRANRLHDRTHYLREGEGGWRSGAAQPVARRNSTAQMHRHDRRRGSVRPQPMDAEDARARAPTTATSPAAPPTCTSR